MATDAEKQIVRDVCVALKALNAAIDKASDAGIEIEFVTAQAIGTRNPTYLLSESFKRERILP